MTRGSVYTACTLPRLFTRFRTSWPLSTQALHICRFRHTSPSSAFARIQLGRTPRRPQLRSPQARFSAEKRRQCASNTHDPPVSVHRVYIEAANRPRGPLDPPRTHEKSPPLSARGKRIRQRPTLPGSYPPSTIGAGGLNYCVRNGNRCDPSAIATGKLYSSLSAMRPLTTALPWMRIFEDLALEVKPSTY